VCGIAGIIAESLPDDARERARAMAESMAHRGPDDHGLRILPHAALAHRRLSIIDLSTAGRQPMANEDDTVLVVCNGEIYNHRDLRRTLEARGHQFRSRTDTEVLVHLYEEEAEAMVHRLRGFFAFAIWDARRQRLFAARDRVGKKPFCYHLAADGAFWFASEAKALVAAGVDGSVDPMAIDAFLRLSYIPAPLTGMRSIRRLPAAHILTLDLGQAARVQRYWRLAYQPKIAIAPHAAAEQLAEVLAEATACRLEADVPLGVFLSGGIDSSLVAALASRASTERVRTFSVGWGGGVDDELKHARRVAEHLGTDHRELRVDPPTAEDVARVVALYDGPFGDPSALPTYLLAATARQHVTVALTGDGGDESFAGYGHHSVVPRICHLFDLPHGLRSLAARSLHHLLPPPRRSGTPLSKAHGMLTMLSEPDVSKATAGLRSVMPRQIVDMLYQPDFRRETLPNSEALEEHGLAPSGRGDVLDRLLGFDVENYLTDCLMVKTDTASMAVALECRSPLLDHHVMEFAARLPSRLKLRRMHGKKILRRVARPLLPPSILRRGKVGFGMPVGPWLRGGLQEMGRDLLAAERPLIASYVRPENVRRMLREHLAGERVWARPLWSLIVLELWLQAS